MVQPNPDARTGTASLLSALLARPARNVRIFGAASWSRLARSMNGRESCPPRCSPATVTPWCSRRTCLARRLRPAVLRSGAEPLQAARHRALCGDSAATDAPLVHWLAACGAEHVVAAGPSADQIAQAPRPAPGAAGSWRPPDLRPV